MRIDMKSILLGIIALMVLISAILYALPHYQVWAAGKAGEAKLREAEQSRQIRIEEAKANLEAAEMDAQAEVARAKGMAEAMKVENGALTPEYIQYLWVRKVDFSRSTTIYIPTEGGLPILEANRVDRKAERARHQRTAPPVQPKPK